MASLPRCQRQLTTISLFFAVFSLLSDDVTSFNPGPNAFSFRHRNSHGATKKMTTHHATDIASTPSSTEKIAECFELVKEEHQAEVVTGFETFGDTRGTDDDAFTSWSDEDFLSYSIMAGAAGPDEHRLNHGNEIFQTTRPVFTEAECDAIIAEARESISVGIAAAALRGDGGDPNEGVTNSELGEARVSTLPKAREWLRVALREKLFPLLESRFGNSENGVRANELTLNDALIIGHVGPSRSQPMHRDTSILSLNVALSPMSGYDGGGGTYFEGLALGDDEETVGTNGKSRGLVQIERGHVLCHAGGAMHAGHGVQSGERWILVLFVLAKDEPQLSRRCHAGGVRAVSAEKQDLVGAEAFFEAGLSVSPRDHLLHQSLGRIFMSRGDVEMAQNCLAISSEEYPLCQDSIMGLGRMLLADGKPLEAFECFDKALNRIADRDLLDGAWMPLRALTFDLRLYAAHCAVVCSENSDRIWSSEHLPEAIRRLRINLSAAPGDERLLGLLGRAVNLEDELAQ